jgi:geranylgeranyl pyrophosphate synthase
MIDFQATFFQQFLDVPQRQRISKIPADRTENKRRFCLPPLEDRRPRTHFMILSRCQPRPTEVATQPAILESPYPDSIKIGLLKTVSNYGLEMVAGPTLDINLRRKNSVTVNEYMACTRGKTGAFLAMATVGGGMIGRASERQLQALHEFAMLAGTAFQITDDILDVEGRKGRDTGSDILEGKRTMLVIHAARTSSAEDARRLFDILNKRREDKTAEEVRWACKLFRTTGAIEYSERTAIELTDQACRLLLGLPETKAKYRLIRISKYLSTRMN